MQLLLLLVPASVAFKASQADINPRQLDQQTLKPNCDRVLTERIATYKQPVCGDQCNVVLEWVECEQGESNCQADMGAAITCPACPPGACLANSVQWNDLWRYDLSFAPILHMESGMVACIYGGEQVQVTCNAGILTLQEECPRPQWQAECQDNFAGQGTPDCSQTGTATVTAWTCPEGQGKCGDVPPPTGTECWKEKKTDCPIVGQCIKSGKHRNRNNKAVPHQAVKQWLQARADWDLFAQTNPDVFDKLSADAKSEIVAFGHSLDENFDLKDAGVYDSQFKGEGRNGGLSPSDCLGLCMQLREFAQAMNWPEEWTCGSVAPISLINSKSGSCWMRSARVYNITPAPNQWNGTGKSVDAVCLESMMKNWDTPFSDIFDALVEASENTNLSPITISHDDTSE